MRMIVTVFELHRRFLSCCIALFIIGLGASVLPSITHADDQQEATQTAQTFDSEFDANHVNQIYDDLAGQFAKSKLTKDAFVSQLTIMRANLGGAANSRSTIQQQSGMDPVTHQPLFNIRYKADFPTTKVYQDLTLIKESPGGWKLYGIYFYPIPQ
jgi:hypothetical protein